LTLVVFESRLMKVGIAILLVDAHLEADTREILLNRCEIGE
jgi:hypothetical protein